jgi:hypothetical protein
MLGPRLSDTRYIESSPEIYSHQVLHARFEPLDQQVHAESSATLRHVALLE